MSSTVMEADNYAHGGYKVVIVASVLILMQTLMVGGRLLSRRLQKVWLGIDDYVLISATVLTITLCALAIAIPRISGVSNTSLQHLPNDKTVRRASIAWLILYGISVALSKLAILFLYLRVFTSQMRAFTLMLTIVGIVVIGTGIANTFIAIFQCSPVPYAWDKTLEGGKCFNELSFARFMAIPNVVDGFVMLVMPIPLVWKLELAIQQKIALTATFLHGIIGFASSLSRLSILWTTNPFLSSSTTSTSLAWTIWTINEPANYIIAACLPTLRPIFVRILPASFFILTRTRASQRVESPVGGSDSRKNKKSKVGTWTWTKTTVRGWGSVAPKVSVGSKGASRLSGPWDGPVWREEEEGGVSEARKKGRSEGVRVSEREIGEV